ncbi:MAG: TolC family protein [Deltaproteobacteria bacterium]|nr:TolC family protein [Deltaproteobacteria bacterium]
MNRKSIVIFCLAFSMTNPVCAGYRELKNEYESYRPPAYFVDQFGSGPEPEHPVTDSAFDAQQKRLEEMKAGWEKALKTGSDEGSFLVPDPKLVEFLKPAQTHTDAAAAAIKGTYSLKQLETLTVLRNPGVKAAEDRLRGAIEAFTQVGALDEILRKYTAFTEDLMPGVGPMRGKEPMKLKFPFPGVMALKGEIVDREIRAERESLEAVRRDAVTAIRKAYWNLIYVIKGMGITSEMLELLEQLDAVVQSRYEAGKTSYQDVIKVRIHRETLHEDLNTLGEQQHNFDSKIREILNLPPGVKLGTPEIRTPSAEIPMLKDLYGIAQQHRQELRRLRDRISKMELMIEMAETMILPPYTLNSSLYEDEAVNQVGSFAQQNTFPIKTEASRGAGLPKMPWYGIEDAYIRETRQQLHALREDLAKTEAATRTRVRYAWFQLDLARRERALYYDDVVQLSRSALDVSTRSYVAGNVAFADVIDAYTTWLKATLTLERKRSDFGIAWANLEQVVGTTLR